MNTGNPLGEKSPQIFESLSVYLVLRRFLVDFPLVKLVLDVDGVFAVLDFARFACELCGLGGSGVVLIWFSEILLQDVL